MEFLNESDVAAAFQKIAVSSKTLSIAVAFWGKESIARLNLKPEKKIRMICNLQSGATNPYILNDLRSTGKIRTNKQLHAKVYLTDHAVIIGSSNASANGLALQDRELRGWIEANVLIDDPAFVRRMKKWFDTLWDGRGTEEITPKIEADALKRWKRNRQNASSAYDGTSIIRAFAERPEAFENVIVAAYTGRLSPEAQEMGRSIKSNGISYEGQMLTSEYFKKAWIYEDWDLENGSWIIDVSIRRKAIMNGIAQVLDFTAPIPKIGGTLQFARPKKGLELTAFDRPLNFDPDEKIRFANAVREIFDEDDQKEDGKDSFIRFGDVMERMAP